MERKTFPLGILLERLVRKRVTKLTKDSLCFSGTFSKFKSTPSAFLAIIKLAILSVKVFQAAGFDKNRSFSDTP